MRRISDMNRRQFISSTGATLLGTAIGSERLFGEEAKLAAGSGISWHRHEGSKLFDRVAVNGQPVLNPEEGVGLFDGWAQIVETVSWAPRRCWIAANRRANVGWFNCRWPMGCAGPLATRRRISWRPL